MQAERGIGSRLMALLCLIAVLAWLPGCSDDPPTGPVEIRYGRDACDFCRMIISDPRYATQIRGGPGHKAYKFDDIGDALHFLRTQSWKDEGNVEIWVMDMDHGKTWLDARKAFYLPGKQSPMAYGFGAVPDARPGAVPFGDMQIQILKRGATSRCLPGEEPAQDNKQSRVPGGGRV